MQDKKILEELNKIINVAGYLSKDSELKPLGKKWEGLVKNEPAKLIKNDCIDFDVLKNFRRRSVFVHDKPPGSDYTGSISSIFSKIIRNPLKGMVLSVWEVISGARRGYNKTLKEGVELLEKDGAADLMKKYPVNLTPGRPYSMDYKGYNVNYRWLRHIYFNNLINRVIGIPLDGDDFISMDIGCSYGAFVSIFKKEHKKSRHVLVDFPEQLLLAHYYLGEMFPDSKIATILDYGDNVSKIDRAFIESYDFVLVPVTQYKRLQENAVDMVTNFVSFGEMRREWFLEYVDSPVFHSAKYFFTCNRFESAPRFEKTYDTDLTILDYPLNKFEKKHFGIFPLFPYEIEPKYKFWYDKRMFSSQHFDYIGVR